MLLRITTLVATIFITHAGFAQCPNLVWADEFDGNSLNTANWGYQIGDGCDINLCGWGNNELQSYQQANAVVMNGELSITARNETAGNSRYTSARIRTINKLDFTYGRIEARIKLPSGGGLWPAFWMLPTDEVYGFWPQSGEIDVMEWVGNEKAKVFGTLHFGQPFPSNRSTGASINSLGGDFGNEYHVYAVEWEANEIRWYIDDFLFSTKTRADLIPERWPFNQDFHLLLNMAVGGNFGGSVNPNIFPATMKVDYVRLYDGNKPSIVGDRFISSTDRVSTFSLSGLETPATINWSVPAGVTILSGQGTSNVRVQWTNNGGFLTADVSTPCGIQTFGIEIAAGLARTSSLENFDDVGEATFDFATGVLTEVQNPSPNTINNSSLVGEYSRSASDQFDVLIYDITGVLGDVSDFEDGTKQFYVDVLSDAPAGTEMLLQLETSNSAPTNFPTGRHSRYRALTGEPGQWNRLVLEYLDSPDGSANPRNIVSAPVLFEPGVNSSQTFFYDNLDIYEVNPTVSTSSIRNENFNLHLLENPVNGQINANISLEKATSLQLVLTNLNGQRLKTLDLGTLSPGQHTTSMQVDHLAQGTYLLSLTTKGVNLRSVSVVKP